MKKINKKITSLVLRVQELVMQTDEFNAYYQSNIALFSIYKLNEDGKYAYRENLYIDGSIQDENYITMKLEYIIESLEEIINETNGI